MAGELSLPDSERGYQALGGPLTDRASVLDIGDAGVSEKFSWPVSPASAEVSLKRMLSDAEWIGVRRWTYRTSGRSCQVCGGVGPSWPVVADAVWEFDASAAVAGRGVQRLLKTVALCPKCFFDRRSVRGFITGGELTEEVLNVLVERAQHLSPRGLEFLEDEVSDAMASCARLEEVDWAVDLRWLVEAGVLSSLPVPQDSHAAYLVDGVIMGGL